MAAAARALGWPEQIVDTTRVQMQNVTKNANSGHRSDDGFMGATDQIAESISYAVQAEIYARLGRHG